MHSGQAGMWDPRPPPKHTSPVPVPLSSNTRLAHVTTATPAKRITFYKSGDSQFGGIRMAIHKRSFKCFDALLDDLSQKVPLPFGVRTVTTPRGTHAIKHIEQLQDGGCYLCSDRRQAKPINMELASKHPSNWYHHSRRPQRPDTASTTPPGHLPYRQRRILLVKNSEPGMRRSVVLNRRSTRSLRAFLDEVSEVMQFHVRKLYTAEGRRIDSVQSLMTCPGVLVCVGREAFSPMLVNFIRKSSEEKLPGLGPRTPGNGARSPAAQGARSPPHGAQSRASEYSEGHESKKNVNFGLETKKSIIHPRSDSSNRSTRFSLSSDKSYGNGVSSCSQARPAIMNDDIEKRVLVNKDGSLSVEMRVRFRLHNDETLQWSTQIKKSPSLTNDSCPLSQAEPHYLQQGQSESCSDPDFMSFDPERGDYSNQTLQCVLEPNHCPCCYQRQALQYDLWENPAHSHKQPPVPPPHPHTSSHTHTVKRHTHSSSSSSSCNSRRVVRCQAQLSSCRGDLGSEQSQLVQEEMCVTEQVEHRVEVEQDGDTHIEMCMVNRCCSRSEVVAIDSNLRPISRKSIEDELEEEEGERPVSAVSSSSHVLQSLKEDQDDEDDELPPSASQCCHCSQPSISPTSQAHLNDKPTSLHSMVQEDVEERESRAVSAASSCHCSAITPHSTAGADNVDRASSSKSKMSRTTYRSSKAKVLNSEEEGAADDEDEEVKRVVSGFSGSTGLSAGSSSVCHICGGCKRGVSTVSNSRASQRFHRSHQASPNPASPVSNQDNGKNGSNGEGSDDSAVSTQSNKTNLTNHECLTNGLEGRVSSAMSRMSNPVQAGNEKERAPSASSATSHKSNRSHKSSCNGDTGVTAEKEEHRSPSAMSAQSILSVKSSKSHKSNCNSTVEAPDIRTREEAEGENTIERAISSLSAKSGVSEKSNALDKSHCQLSSKVASPTDNTVIEEQGDINKRASSSLSVKSNATKERPDSKLSAKSAVTAKSSTSHRPTCSHCAKAESLAAKVVITKETGQEEGKEEEERAASAMSAKSNLSVKSNKSCKSTKASERSLSPRSEAKRDGEERAASKMSARSVKSNVSAKSCKSDCNGNETAASQKGKENEMVEVETQQRPESMMSSKLEKEERAASVGSSKCDGNTEADSEREDSTGDGENPKERTASALSGPSGFSHHTKTESPMSVKLSKSQKSNHEAMMSPNPNEADVPSIETKEEETQNESQERVATAMSSARSSASHKSISNKSLKSVSLSHNIVTIKTPEGTDGEGNETERSPSAASATSKKSSISSKSNHSGTADVVEDNAPRSNDPEDSHGQMLSPRGARSPRTHSPKTPTTLPRSTQSPVQQLLPGGETRGSSALSVKSTTSAKSGRSRCRCGASSAKKDKEGEDKQVVNKEENEEVKREEASERASIMSSSSRKQRRESGGTEPLLSRNSSGSVSLGLPEDQETAESDSGKSSVSFKGRVKCPDVPQSPEESSVKKDVEGTVSTVSNSNGSKCTLSHNPPAVEIPTIETPGEGKDESEEGGQQKTKRTASANSAKSNRSYRSSCKCSVKTATEITDSEPKEGHASASQTKAANDLEAETVKSSSTAKASNLGTDDNRTSSTMSSSSPKNANVATMAAGDSEDIADKSPCCLRLASAASTQSKQSKGQSSVKSDYVSPVTCHKSKSKAGSSSGRTKTSHSQKKETPIKSSSKGETCSESTLSHSLSAADLLKETMAAARPRSCQSKASKTSDKVRSEKSTRCQRSRKQKDHVEEPELTPACLPNASPSDVVSDWLRSIPDTSSMLTVDDELNEMQQEIEEKPAEDVAKEEEAPEDDNLEKEEKTKAQEEEEKEGEIKCEEAVEENTSGPAPVDVVGTSSCPNTLLLTGESLPRNWHSSAAVMKVLLSSSLGRCRSMPEVSPVYGRRLSTSARGLLDCLAQLQLIEPAVSPGCDQQKHCNQQYEDIMAILQSLWLSEPQVIEAKEAKDGGKEQVTPPRSSSGVDMSSGSGGSAKENGNQGEDETPSKETESIHEKEGAKKAVDEKEEGNAEEGDNEIKVEPEETMTKQATTDIDEEHLQSEEQSTVPPSLDGPKPDGNPSSSDKSSANDSSKSPTDNEQETLEDTSSGTPPTVLRAPLTKRLSQDPDPVWVLHLLKKLEKQFINHYIDAMAEFKVRWDLDDNLILNTMIKELRDEVSRRIQSSIEREVKKIQSRAGKGGRSPRPPQGRNLSRESTMTEKRRRMLKVMKNQSVKTADSVSDEDTVGDFSDQRSDDEYCPCDACVRKKMAARPLKTNPMAAEAPVMMEFDLLKILQLKKSPSPAAVPQTVEVENDEEERNLEVVQEEEEEDETKEDIKADVVLEETIVEEDEKTGQEKEEEVETENEGNTVGDEEWEEGETDGEGVQEDVALENGDQEEEEGGAECQCHTARNDEESDEAEEGDEELEGEAEETSNNTGEDETADNEEKAEEGEGENAEAEEEAEDCEEESGTGEEDSDNETVKEATAGEGGISENGEGEEVEMTGRESGDEEASGETEDDSAAKSAANEESTLVEEFAEGNVGTSAEAEDEKEAESHEDEKGGETDEQEGEASEVEGASPTQEVLPAVCVTEGEEADAEDSDTDCKRASETSVDESGREGAGTTGDEEEKEGGGHGDEEEVVGDAVEEFKPEEENEEEVNSNKKEDGALLHQFTRTSVESQPGSLEDIDTDSPQNSIEVPKMAAGVSTGAGKAEAGKGRSRSPGRIKRHKPKESV